MAWSGGIGGPAGADHRRRDGRDRDRGGVRARRTAAHAQRAQQAEDPAAALSRARPARLYRHCRALAAAVGGARVLPGQAEPPGRRPRLPRISAPRSDPAARCRRADRRQECDLRQRRTKGVRRRRGGDRLPFRARLPGTGNRARPASRRRAVRAQPGERVPLRYPRRCAKGGALPKLSRLVFWSVLLAATVVAGLWALGHFAGGYRNLLALAARLDARHWAVLVLATAAFYLLDYARLYTLFRVLGVRIPLGTGVQLTCVSYFVTNLTPSAELTIPAMVLLLRG